MQLSYSIVQRERLGRPRHYITLKTRESGLAGHVCSLVPRASAASLAILLLYGAAVERAGVGEKREVTSREEEGHNGILFHKYIQVYFYKVWFKVDCLLLSYCRVKCTRLDTVFGI